MPKEELTEDIKKRSGWSILMGVLTAILGVVLIAYPLATATITTLLLGWLLIIVGIAEVIFALHSQTAGKFFWKIAQGVIYLIAGVGLAFFPITGLAALTLFLGISARMFRMSPEIAWSRVSLLDFALEVAAERFGSSTY